VLVEGLWTDVGCWSCGTDTDFRLMPKRCEVLFIELLTSDDRLELDQVSASSLRNQLRSGLPRRWFARYGSRFSDQGTGRPCAVSCGLSSPWA